MKLRVSITLLVTAIAIMVGCSEGGTQASVQVSDDTAQVETLTERYPSGRLMASGTVRSGTVIRVGQWTTWYDSESGAKHWEGQYADGVVDQSKHWCEWNEDGSVRMDSTDL